jgi:hypothetical protein
MELISSSLVVAQPEPTAAAIRHNRYNQKRMGLV